jgi:hypothetical protein
MALVFRASLIPCVPLAPPSVTLERPLRYVAGTLSDVADLEDLNVNGRWLK